MLTLNVWALNFSTSMFFENFPELQSRKEITPLYKRFNLRLLNAYKNFAYLARRFA